MPTGDVEVNIEEINVPNTEETANSHRQMNVVIDKFNFLLAK